VDPFNFIPEWGPKPMKFSHKPLGGSSAVICSWVVTWCATCEHGDRGKIGSMTIGNTPSKDSILEWVDSVSFEVRPDGTCTRTISGRVACTFPIDLYNSTLGSSAKVPKPGISSYGEVDALMFYVMSKHRHPPGYRRSFSRSISSDRRTLTYKIVDTRIPSLSGYPPGVDNIRMVQTRARKGVEPAAAELAALIGGTLGVLADALFVESGYWFGKMLMRFIVKLLSWARPTYRTVFQGTATVPVGPRNKVAAYEALANTILQRGYPAPHEAGILSHIRLFQALAVFLPIGGTGMMYPYLEDIVVADDIYGRSVSLSAAYSDVNWRWHPLDPRMFYPVVPQPMSSIPHFEGLLVPGYQNTVWNNHSHMQADHFGAYGPTGSLVAEHGDDIVDLCEEERYKHWYMANRDNDWNLSVFGQLQGTAPWSMERDATVRPPREMVSLSSIDPPLPTAIGNLLQYTSSQADAVTVMLNDMYDANPGMLPDKYNGVDMRGNAGRMVLYAINPYKAKHTQTATGSSDLLSMAPHVALAAGSVKHQVLLAFKAAKSLIIDTVSTSVSNQYFVIGVDIQKSTVQELPVPLVYQGKDNNDKLTNPAPTGMRIAVPLPLALKGSEQYTKNNQDLLGANVSLWAFSAVLDGDKPVYIGHA